MNIQSQTMTLHSNVIASLIVYVLTASLVVSSFGLDIISHLLQSFWGLLPIGILAALGYSLIFRVEGDVGSVDKGELVSRRQNRLYLGLSRGKYFDML